ncbi:MAG: DedA family protein [Acidimicrobiales bacterium]
MLHGIVALHGTIAYLIVGALCFGEASVFVGFVLPGETAVVLGGVLASFHHVGLVRMLVLVVACAIVGDSVGYEVGRRFGPSLVRRLPGRARRGAEEGRRFLERRGGPAVFLGRFTAVFRAVIPGAAGLSAMRYRTFLFWNALGGLCWGVAFTLAGYGAGRSYERVISAAGTASTSIGALLAVAVAGFLVWRRVRGRRDGRETPSEAPEAGAEDTPLADEELGALPAARR